MSTENDYELGIIEEIVGTDNPWNIKSIQDLLYYNCPDCHSKYKFKQDIVKHVVNFHPECLKFLIEIEEFGFVVVPSNDETIENEDFMEDLDDDEVDITDSDMETSSQIEENGNWMNFSSDLQIDRKIIMLDHDYAFQIFEAENEDENMQDESVQENNTENIQTFQSNDRKIRYELSCAKCNNVFENTSKLIQHFNESHVAPENGMFTCEKCGKSFALQESLRKHIENKKCANIIPLSYAKNHYEKQMVYECPTCEITFTGNEKIQAAKEYKNHVKDVHDGQKQYPRKKCHLCEKSFKNTRNLHSHQACVHDFISSSFRKGHKCDICEKVFGNVNNLKKHKFKDHGTEKDFKCDLCDKAFYLKWQLEQHISFRHVEFDKKDKKYEKYQCDICFAEYSSSCGLKNHVTLKHKKSIRCENCGKYFGCNSRLKKHHRIEHDTTLERPYKCIQCNKCFPEQNDLKSHEKFMHVITQCDICKKEFKNKQTCLKHKRIHVAKRNYVCEKCGKTFFRPRDLKAHTELVHEKLEKYSCTQCDKKFVYPTTLSDHILKVHKKQVNNKQCDICGKSFFRASNLKMHVESVHEKQRNHKCQFCENAYYLKSKLKIHIQKKHPKYKVNLE